VRSVDLAIYADTLAARASDLAAQLERARGRVRRAAIEREARGALAEETVTRLEAVGLLRCPEARDECGVIADLVANLHALEELQAWVERQLADLSADAAGRGRPPPSA
jgi:hypothetical protein